MTNPQHPTRSLPADAYRPQPDVLQDEEDYPYVSPERASTTEQNRESNADFVNRTLSKVHTLSELDEEAVEKRKYLRAVLNKESEDPRQAQAVYNDFLSILRPAEKIEITEALVKRFDEKDGILADTRERDNNELRAKDEDIEKKKKTLILLGAIAGLLALVALIFGLLWGGGNSSEETALAGDNTKIEQLEDDLSAKNQKIADLENDIKGLNGKLSSVNKTKGNSANSSAKQIAELENQIAAKDRTIRNLRSDIQDLEERPRATKTETQQNTVTQTTTVTQTAENKSQDK